MEAIVILIWILILILIIAATYIFHLSCSKVSFLSICGVVLAFLANNSGTFINAMSPILDPQLLHFHMWWNPISPMDLIPFPLVDHPVLMNALMDSSSEYDGVSLLYLPDNVGKSTYLRELARRLKQNPSRNTIYITLSGAIKLSANSICDQLGIFGSLVIALSNMNKPTTLIVDQVEFIREDPAFPEFVHQLATGSRDSMIKGPFTVILGINDINLANAILKKNSGIKIRPIGNVYNISKFFWNRTQVDAFLEPPNLSSRSERNTPEFKEKVRSFGYEYPFAGIIRDLFKYGDFELAKIQGSEKKQLAHLEHPSQAKV